MRGRAGMMQIGCTALLAILAGAEAGRADEPFSISMTLSAPVTEDSRKVIEPVLVQFSKNLSVLNKSAKNAPGDFMPVAYARYLLLGPEWAEYQYEGFYPNAEVDPNFSGVVLKDFQNKLPSLRHEKTIDAYFILYAEAGQIHLLLMDTDGLKKDLVAPFPKKENGYVIKLEDFGYNPQMRLKLSPGPE